MGVFTFVQSFFNARLFILILSHVPDMHCILMCRYHWWACIQYFCSF